MIYEFRAATEDAVELCSLLSEGIKAARVEAAPRPKLSRFARKPHVAAFAVFRLFSTFLASEVELFTRQYVEHRVTPAVVARFRGTSTQRTSLDDLPRDPAKALVRLHEWLKPSASSRLRWSKRMQAVLDVRLESPLAELLDTLILCRNELVHPRRREWRINWADPDIAEVIGVWMLAAMLLTIRVAEAETRRTT